MVALPVTPQQLARRLHDAVAEVCRDCRTTWKDRPVTVAESQQIRARLLEILSTHFHEGPGGSL